MSIMEVRSRRPSHGHSIPSSALHRQAPLDRSLSQSHRHDTHFDAEPAYASFAEPPNKFRKTQAHIDKSKGIGTNTHSLQATEITLAQPSDDSISLPYPTHVARVEPADPTPFRAPPRESLRNGLGRAGVPAPPADSPRCSIGLSDFSPWERKHQEDVLTDSVTRGGYYEKVLNSVAETVSARPSLITCIKNKVACDSVSDLLVACIERRQRLCTISNKNTFKPPPRVTLTDNKREAWLKDLADGAIPLRRLSRTIPHGIRGKCLLQHCLAKHVPSWRAVWLVKCVGSNEIRSFRRKGAGLQSFGGGGEVKWLKDWTDSVLDFIDELAKVATPGRSEGRKDITYALSLVSHVYHERLLDQDLFTQCLARRLRDVQFTNTNACSLWLSVVKQYLGDLLRYYDRGCELVKCLLGKLEPLRNLVAPKGAPAVLQEKCRRLLLAILRDRPISFILPGTWSRCSSLVRNMVPDQDPQLMETYKDLERRNALLDFDAAAISAQGLSEFESSRAEILAQFDTAPEPELFMSTIQRLASTPQDLVDLPIKWCTSSERSGLASIYLVARTIRLIAKKLAYSCQDDIASVLSATDLRNKAQARRLYMLVAELVRSHHFSLSKYLHHLLARGLSTLKKDCLAVLSYIPRQALSTEVLNLASDMCASFNCSLISNKDEVDFQVAAMQLAISKCRPASGLTAKDYAHISSLDTGTRSAIALHLRKDVATKRAEQSYPSPDEHDSMDLDAGSLQSRLPATLSTFELLQDFPTLADVLLLFIPNADLDSLILLASCVKCHHANFQAMSALQRLFTDLLKRYVVLHQDGLRDRYLTSCIIDIARLIPNTRQTVALLENHFDTLTAESGIPAFSPPSELNLDVPQAQDFRSLADVERALQRGNIMSEALLSKVLSYLVTTLETSQHHPEQMSNALKLLGRSAESDKAAFSRILAKYLHPIVVSKSADAARKVLPWIVAGELCPVDEMLASCLKMAGDASKKIVAPQMALNILVGVASPPTVDLCNCVRQYYAFTMIQRELFGQKREKLARLTEIALQATSRGLAQTKDSELPDSLSEIVHRLLSNNSDGPEAQFEEALTRLAADGAPVEEILCRIINIPSGKLEGKQAPPSPTTIIHRITDTAGLENVASCRVIAQIELNKLERSKASSEALRQAASSFIADGSIWLRMRSWTAFVKNMSPRFASILHDFTLHEVVDILNPVMISMASNDGVSNELEHSWPRLQALNNILRATQSKLDPKTLTASFEVLSESLRGLAAALHEGRVVRNHDSDLSTRPLDMILGLFLDLSAMHLHSPNVEQLGQENLTTFCITMSNIFTGTQNASLVAKSTSTTLLDILLVATGALAEDNKYKCFKHSQSMSGTIPSALQAVFGPCDKDDFGAFFHLESLDDLSLSPAASTDMPSSTTSEAKAKIFNLDPWEMLQDTTPSVGPNDTCLSLRLFGARKPVFKA